LSADPAAPGVDPAGSGSGASVLQRLCRASAAAGVAVLLGCALVTAADIVGRKTVGWSLPGLIDLSQLLVMTSVFLCIPYTFERRANIEVDLVHGRLPARVRTVLAVVWSLASAAFLAAVTWHAGAAAAQVIGYGERSPTLGWPMVLYWLPVVLGCAAAAAVCIVQAFHHPREEGGGPLQASSASSP
jgi:TRAP-type C4-dicarboxylate transport system permease small subunit